MTTSSRAARFGRGVAWNIGGQVVLLAAAAVLIPLVVRGLGEEGYALYGLIGVLSGHFMLLTFGASTATTHAMAEEHSRGGRGLASVGRRALALSAFPVAVGAAAAFALRGTLSGLLSAPQTGAATARTIVASAAAGAVFLSLNQFCAAVFTGLQQFGLASINSVAQGGGFLLITAGLVASGKGVRAAAMAYPAFQLLVAAIQVPLAWRQLRRADETASTRGVLDLFRYGFASFLTQLAWSVTFQWDKLLIGHYCPLASLGYYMIPSFVMQKLLMFPLAVSGAAFPFVTELSGRGDDAGARRLFAASSRIVLLSVLPAFVFLAVFAPQFLTLWLGPNFSEHGVWPLRWLAVGYGFYTLSLVPSTSSYALGAPQRVLAWGVAQAAISVAAWPLLIPRLGPAGAALGFLAGQAVATVPFVFLVAKFSFGLDAQSYARDVVGPPTIAALALIATLWPLQRSVWSPPLFLALAAAAGLLYYAVAWRLLPRDDRETLQDMVRRRLRG